MKDFIYDWKHAISRDNTSGSRFFFMLMTLVLPLSFILGIVSVVVGCVSSNMFAIIVGIILVCLAVATVVFLAKNEG